MSYSENSRLRFGSTFLLVLAFFVSIGISTTTLAAPIAKLKNSKHAQRSRLLQSGLLQSGLLQSKSLIRAESQTFGSATFDANPPENLTTVRSTALHTANKSAIIELSWSDVKDNIGVTGYIIERSTEPGFLNPKIYQLDAVNQYRDETVRPDTKYYWRIKAKDAAGNLSPLWMSFTESTLPAPVINKQLTIEGDSASVGYGLPGYAEGPPEVYSSEQWGKKLGDMLDGTWVVRTVAAGGDRILGNITTDRAKQIKAFRKTSYERDIVMLWAGSNDIYGLAYRNIPPTPPLTVYKGMKSYAEAVKADGFEVWIMDAYTRSALGGPNKDLERREFNNFIRADSTFADKFIDIDAWSELRTRLNKTYYQADETHLTSIGNELVATRIYAELITSPLMITTGSSLPEGRAGASYSQSIASTGGTGTREVSLVSGKLPDGLSLTNGELKGTMTSQGTSAFTLKVKDSIGTSVNRKFTLRSNAAG